MLKTIVIIIGYILNNFTTHIIISQQMMEKYIISNLKKKFIFWEKKKLFCQCGIRPQAMIAFPTTFISKSPLGNQNPGNPFCMLHIQPSKLQNDQLCYLGFIFAINNKMMIISRTHGVQLNKFHNLSSSIFSPQCLHEHFGSFLHIENLLPQHNQIVTFLNHK